jgi:hypothetical protein
MLCADRTPPSPSTNTSSVQILPLHDIRNPIANDREILERVAAISSSHHYTVEFGNPVDDEMVVEAIIVPTNASVRDL